MKTSIIFITLIIVISTGCNKGIENDDQYLRGRVFLTDTITQQANGTPVANRKVYLTLPNDSLNFLYTATTNSEGYFTFTLLPEWGTDFVIRTFDSSKSYIYFSRKEAKKGETNLVVIEHLDENAQNGFIAKTTDDAGNILTGTKVYFYNSSILATQGSPAGTVDSFTSNKEGKFFKLKLNPGTYYVNAIKTIDTAVFLSLAKQIQVPATGFVYYTIPLSRKVTSYKNGYNLVVMDSTGGFIPNATVYVYNSQVLAAANTLSGVFESYTTDNYGKKSRYDLVAGDYYINVSKTVSDTITYQSLGNKISLPFTGIINDTIILKRKK